MVSKGAAFHAGSYGGLQEKSFVITFQSFTVRVLPLPPQNEIRVAIKSLLLFVYLVFELRKATLRDATKVKVAAESTGNVSDLTYSISGAASKVSLSNYYSFCLVLVLL